MAFCTHCGTEISGKDSFCTKCGKPLSAPISSDLNPAIIHALCYLFLVIGGVVFLNLEPYKWQKDTRFHAWQSIYFCGAWLALAFLSTIMSIISGFFWFLTAPLGWAMFVVWIIAMVMAAQGKVFRIPILADLAQKEADKA